MIVTFAIPFALVFALYVFPLNLKVIVFPLINVFPLVSLAVKTSFLADFLTVTLVNVNFRYLNSQFDVVPPYMSLPFVALFASKIHFTAFAPCLSEDDDLNPYIAPPLDALFFVKVDP